MSDEEPEYASEGSSLASDEIPDPRSESWGESSSQNQRCICMKPDCVKNISPLLKSMLKLNVNISLIPCIITTLEHCINEVLEFEKGELTWARIMLVDSFYRFRHEILSKVFALSIGIPFESTDQSFQIFGIESNRTPDFIVNKGQISHIIEVTASSNEEKSYLTKGLESAGFEPKYQKEITELRRLGHKIEYWVVFFNMSDPDSSSAFKVLEEMKDFEVDLLVVNSLKLLNRGLSRITLLTKNYFAPASSLLFSKGLEVVSKHSNLEFLYENADFNVEFEYRDFCISLPVYQKINNLWPRLSNIKDRQLSDDCKFLPVLDLTSNRISFYQNSKGIEDSEFNEILAKGDKLRFFELLSLRVGNRLEPASNSEGGVRYTKRVKKKPKISTIEKIELTSSHGHSCVSDEVDETDSKKYKDLISTHYSSKFLPKYFDKDYESKMVKSICDFDTDCTMEQDSSTFTLPKDSPKTLAHYKSKGLDIKNISSVLLESLKKENDFNTSIPIRNQKMKSSFILPIATLTQSDRCKISEKNTSFIEQLSFSNIGDYTKAILSKTLDIDYNFYTEAKAPSESLNSKYNIRYKISNKITRIVKIAMKRMHAHRFEIKMLEGEDLEEFNHHRTDISKINKEINVMEKDEGVKKNIGMVRLKSSSKSVMGASFRKEMSHFKDKSFQSSIEGIGLKEDVNTMRVSLEKEFEGLMESMTMNCGENNDFLIDLKAYGDVRLLKELKQHTLDNYSVLIKMVKDSMLGHSAAFISRYSHSLLFYSQLPFNSDYIRVDNLGYSNVLLIVRGGSKIFKTKSSKLHRLIFPVSLDLLKQYIDTSYGESSFKSFNYLDQWYIITPWTMMHESILLDSISFYPRICSFCTLNLNPELTFASQFGKIFVNVLLAFHNRRQTESMLANLRYILLSTMGDYSAFCDILPEFLSFNYDKVQAYIRLQIINNYPFYYESISGVHSKSNLTEDEFRSANVKNIITSIRLDNVDDLALMIYSTFLMTKAPYQRPVERANNLKGILSIHEQFDREVGLNCVGEEQLKKISVKLESSYIKYSKDLMNCDFNLDPYYCTQVGLFAESYFSRGVGSDTLLMEWIKIMNKNWDSMATTTGLRGTLDKDFFGQKGYFVIYDYIMNDLNYTEKIKDALSEDKTSDEKKKLIRELNLTYGSTLNNPPKTLVFHAVDKRQWRGGREIYVMDMETKRMQQPIEKYMSYLCKCTDTELISIPSDKRSQVIHHSLFEKDIPDNDLKTWFLTLDCSKWAPKSMFIKFALMILPMCSIPSSFKTHFLNYLSLLYSKRLYFNKQEVTVLKNNVNYKDISMKYLISEESINGFYMVQPYSWVMGIFNYTSSLMHAFNQKYCSYLLRETTLSSFNEECTLFMFAHSDDSGGRINVTSERMLVRSLFIYEINLKACNHLLSRKKCVISRIYFEILSIIYMFSRLLALLPKFLGGIRFLPTDKGPAHDMLQTYSKGIEILVAGADFNTSYLYQKFYSAEVWRFYNNGEPKEYDYDRPVQFLGMPDAHPLMVLMTGSDSDVIRLLTQNKMSMIITLIKLFKHFDLFESDEGLLKSLKFIVKIRGVKGKFKNSIFELEQELNKWSLSNVNYKSTPLNALTFLKRLNDPGFTGSLVNETEVRRMSRAYFFRAGESISTKFGPKKLNDIMSLISEVQLLSQAETSSSLFSGFFGSKSWTEFKEEVSVDNPDNNHILVYFKDIYANPLKLCDYLDRMNFNVDNIKKVTRTLKPTHMQIVKFGRGFSTKFDPTQLISYIYEPEMSWALPNPDNLIEAKEDFFTLMKHLGLDKNDLDPGTALKIVRSHQNKSVKDIYLYSCIPGYIRMIKNFSGMLTFLATNSFHNNEIQGLTLKLKSNLSEGPITELDIDESSYYITTLMDVLTTFGQHINLNNIDLNSLEFLGFRGGDISSFIEVLSKRKYTDDNYAYYSHYVEYIKLKYVIWAGEPTGDIFTQGAYYTYLKEQKFRGVWYGKGTLAFYFRSEWLVFSIYHNRIIDCTGNLIGKVDRRFITFVNDTLINNNIEPNFSEPLTKRYEFRNNYYFGYDLSGDISVENYLNMRGGVDYKYQGQNHSFVDEIKSSLIQHVKENMFIARTNDGRSHKVYSLRVSRSEIIPILKTLVNPDSMVHILNSKGYDSYAEFISQSILCNYGAEYYVSLKSLSEGFMGSILYELMIETQSKRPELLPRRFKTAKLPAPEGSLLRMIIGRQNEEDVEILKIPRELNPSIMSIRNEYPESFSVILAEKMVESFKSMYDDSEQLMLADEFIKAASNDDPDKVRSACVKLMCYWGYSGLVNTLQTYTFRRGVENHSVINMSACKQDNKNFLSKLFIILQSSIFDSLRECYNPNIKMDIVNEDFICNDIDELQKYYLIETAFSCYDYKTPFFNPSLNLIRLNNLLLGVLRDSTFVKSLVDRLAETYPLNTLSFEPKNSDETITTLNTLRLIWIQSNKTDPYPLRYDKMYQHLPHTLTQPLSLMKDLGVPGIKPGRLKFHYFLNDELYHELKRESLTLNVEGERYIIEQEIVDLSETRIPTNHLFAFGGVLNEDYLESDPYSDIMYEMDSIDPDMELINDSIEESEDMYLPTEMKKRGRSIIVPIKWVVIPYIEGVLSVNKRCNNTSENLVVLSNCIIRKFTELRNSKVYIVNYGKKPGDLTTMFCHVMSNKWLKNSFWDKYIGGKRLSDPYSIVGFSFSDKIRVNGKSKGIAELGTFIGEDVEEADATPQSGPLDAWTRLNFTEEESIKLYEEREELKQILNDINSTIDAYVLNGSITEERGACIKEKYKNAALSKFKPMCSIILKSFLTETELINVNDSIVTGGLTEEVSAVDQIKMMQAPESFGTAYLHSKPDSKAFKDIRYKAELDSLGEGLSDLISSSTLSISHGMFKVVKSHYNSWRYAAENTKFKRENKKFFLNLFLSILNTSSRHNKSKHDKLWQDLVNNFALIIGDENEEDDLDLNYRLPPSSGLRMKYKVSGFE